MTHHTDAELLPCPFCGGRAEAKKPDMSYEFTFIKCQECDAQTYEGVDFEDAAEAWNRRAPAVPVPDVTDAMIEAANEAHCPFGDMHLAIQAAIAAATQPPEAAPVQLPEPIETVRYWRDAYANPNGDDHFIGHGMVVKIFDDYLALLAQHGIK